MSADTAYLLGVATPLAVALLVCLALLWREKRHLAGLKKDVQP